MDENKDKRAVEPRVDLAQEQETSAALHEARELLESARNAKRRFMALPKADREALLRFLRGL